MSNFIVRTKIMNKTKIEGLNGSYNVKYYHKEMARFLDQSSAIEYALERHRYVKKRWPNAEMFVRRNDRIPNYITTTKPVYYDADFVDPDEDGKMYSILISIERVSE